MKIYMSMKEMEDELKINNTGVMTAKRDRYNYLDNVNNYLRDKLSGATISKSTFKALNLVESSILPYDFIKDIIITTHTSELINNATVTQFANLEVPALTYSEEDDEIKATGDLIEFISTDNTLVFTEFSELLILANDNVYKTMVDIIQTVLWDKVERMCFSTVTSEARSLYNNTKIASKVGSTIYGAIVAALKALPKGVRKRASIVMDFDTYAELAETISEEARINFTTLLGKPIVLVEGATKPIVGDLSKLHINLASMRLGTDKEVKKGVITMALRAAVDIKVTMPEAFKVAEVATGN